MIDSTAPRSTFTPRGSASGKTINGRAWWWQRFCRSRSGDRRYPVFILNFRDELNGVQTVFVLCRRVSSSIRGDSAIPKDGLDLKTAAIRIHALAQSLGINRACIVGHDIGLMVAYAYAAMYPNEAQKLVVMDAFLPGVAGWEPYYNNPDLWHFRFHGEYPEALVRGRESIYFAYFWNELAADKTHSVPVIDRQAYVAAYSGPGRMRAGWAYFAAWPQTAKDFAELAKTKLNMPVLAMAGEKASAATLFPQMKLVANNVTVVGLKDTGHWLMEERPRETMDALLKFL